MSDTVLVLLPEPPVVRQGMRHICWAAAYESWARGCGYGTRMTAATNMVSLLGGIGRGADAASACVLDDDERLLPAGVSNFALMAGMRVGLWAPRRLSGERLAAQLRRGLVWLWSTPSGGGVAHIVVVYGVVYDAKKQPTVLYMDPNRGLVRELWSTVVEHSRIFAVGTPLIPRITVDPFAGLLEGDTHAPVDRDPFLSLL